MCAEALVSKVPTMTENFILLWQRITILQAVLAPGPIWLYLYLTFEFAVLGTDLSVFVILSQKAILHKQTEKVVA